MAPLVTQHTCSFSKILLVLSFLCVLLASSFISAQSQNNASSTRRMLGLDIDDNNDDDDSPQPIKKKSISIIDDSSHPIKKKSNLNSFPSSKNKTKLIKSTTGSSKNQTKLTKISSSSGFGSLKNQTKLAKVKLSLSDSVSGSTKNKTKLIKPTPEEKLALKSQLKKLNSTSTKSSNSTKTTSPATKKTSSDLSKISSSLPKNKTTKVTTTKDLNESKSKNPTNKNAKKAKTTQPYWLENDEDDLISGLSDLPSKFQETLLPDLEKISETSKIYINKANKQLTNNFKPIVGNKYAPTISSIISFAFVLIPLILVSLVFNKIKAYFSLQRLLIFIQVYLSIYFSILCLSSLLTGLEPLKFFYATSQSTYICLQLLQTLAYVLYLLMLLMYLVLVFSTDTGPVTKMIGLTQTFVGFAVGLHYYMTVFHKAVLRQPPKTSWRIHAIYATCFLLICLLTRAERMKKTYLGQGGEEGKKS